MKKTTKIIIVSIVAAILLLGIGYAAISNITLNIGGTLEADPNQANFVVRFTGTPTVSNASKVTASITDDLNAKIDVKDLETVGESVTAEYTVENASEDLSADLAVATTNSNEEYFTIKAELGKTSLVTEETTTVLVTATLTKAPITESVTATVNVALTAMPVEPGQEGTSSGINDSSQSPESTLATLGISNENIGAYIDLGNNIIGETATTDDWRVLYVEGDIVYAILADYLPNNAVKLNGNTYVEDANLSTVGDYQVYGDVFTELNDKTNWIELANEISGASVIGSPTYELLNNSYAIKNQETLNGNVTNFGSDTLYVPRGLDDEGAASYWMASNCAPEEPEYVWYVLPNGAVSGYSTSEDYASAIRPVVELPASTNAELVNGIWTIEK